MSAYTLTIVEEEHLLPIDEEPRTYQRWFPGAHARTRIANTLWVALNAIATIAIVFINKHTLSDQQLRQSQVLIAIWHFAMTFLVLLGATHRRWRLFTAVRLPVAKVLPLSAFFAGFLILSNLSLASNPVGFYQLSKILTAPCVVFINFVLFRRCISRAKVAAVLITCAGVALVSVQSFRSNLIGTVIAAAAFTITGFYQIWIGKKIVDLGVDAPQLLLNQSAVAACLLIPVSFALDVFPDFSAVPSRTLLFLLGGGIVASFINLTQFVIIGRTSALTFNIVSNLKMLVILSLGWYSDGKVFSGLDMLGMVLALAGAWQYGRESMKD